MTVAHAGALWVLGGQTSYEPDVTEPPPGTAAVQERFYSDCWRSTDGRSWTCVADQLPWGPRGMMGGNLSLPLSLTHSLTHSLSLSLSDALSSGGSAVKDGRMWLLGGGTYETPSRRGRTFANDCWSSVDGVEWKLHTASAPWEPRQYHDCAVWDDKLWVLAGAEAVLTHLPISQDLFLHLYCRRLRCEEVK